jgi:hypothetical protein
MREGDTAEQARNRREERVFVVSCVGVFLIIVACALYFVVKVLG